MAEKFSSSATTLAAAITSNSATTITVASNAGFDAVTTAGGDHFHVVIDDERIKVTDNSSTTWTVVRGQDGSTATTHAINAPVTSAITGTFLETAVVSAATVAHRHTSSNLAAPPASPVVGDLWTVRDAGTASPSAMSGMEIDTAESAVPYSVTGSGIVHTLIPGMSITVPPQSRPWKIEFDGLFSFDTGTSVVGSHQGIFVALYESTAATAPPSNTLYGYTQANATQPPTGATTTGTSPGPYTTTLTGSSKVYGGSLRIMRRFPPTTTTRTFSLYARLQVAAITNWAAVWVYGDDAPTSGTYPPYTLTASTL